VSPSIIGSVLGANAQPAAGEATGGAADLPYTVPNIRVDHCLADTAVPTGWCRSVFSTQTPFANECFLDEIAAAQGKDRLAQTYGWFMGLGASEIPQHLAAAERYSRGLPRRDSLLIRGSKLAEVDGDMDAIPLFEDLVARYADDVEAWHGLGDALFHMGAQANRPITAAIGPLERTLALDPTTRPRSFT
jgi:CO/xanthine dehydrogenase Mo-binding subunit